LRPNGIIGDFGIGGCEKSFGLVVRFLGLAADLGYTDAQHQYYPCLWEGCFVVTDYSCCWRCAEMPGQVRNAIGQCRCGRCLEKGRGLAKDLGRSAEYFKLSADQGGAHGQNGYADCLYSGHLLGRIR
jgi:TPR repeat protein